MTEQLAHQTSKAKIMASNPLWSLAYFSLGKIITPNAYQWAIPFGVEKANKKQLAPMENLSNTDYKKKRERQRCLTED